MERTASEFLRGLRGRRSQLQVARRLGYRGNPITDWERGSRFPTAEETLRFATLSGIDVAGAFSRFASGVPWLPGSNAIADWLEALRAETPLTELAQRAGASRFSIARWLSGAAKPRLPDFFRLVDALTGRLPEWAAELVPIESLPSLATRFQAAAAATTDAQAWLVRFGSARGDGSDGGEAFYCDCSNGAKKSNYHLLADSGDLACGPLADFCMSGATPVFDGEEECLPISATSDGEGCHRVDSCGPQMALTDEVSLVQFEQRNCCLPRAPGRAAGPGH